VFSRRQNTQTDVAMTTKKTLGISVKNDMYQGFNNELNKYNENRKLQEKLTLSKFLYELLRLGFNIYKMNNNSFKKADEHIDRMIKERSEKAEEEYNNERLQKNNIKVVPTPMHRLKIKIFGEKKES